MPAIGTFLGYGVAEPHLQSSVEEAKNTDTPGEAALHVVDQASSKVKKVKVEWELKVAAEKKEKEKVQEKLEKTTEKCEALEKESPQTPHPKRPKNGGTGRRSSSANNHEQ